MWNTFWSKKLLTLKRQGVHTFSRRLRYRDREIKIGDEIHQVRVAEEKGIDIRIALDCVGLALNEEYEVGLIFSQDQDDPTLGYPRPARRVGAGGRLPM
jgi:uncharacterized LabA/DUF88 family protein